MSAILPPSERIWWKTPIGREEIIWISISLLWCLIMFAMMPLWHFYGKQNLSSEAYRITPQAFSSKVQEMVKLYQAKDDKGALRMEGNIPVVHPPAGSDVYLQAGGWRWYPILELEKDKSYRFHISSLDYQHGFSLQPININLQILPGYDMVLKITPDTAGEFAIICNEYCGFITSNVNHHTMVGKIYVKE